MHQLHSLSRLDDVQQGLNLGVYRPDGTVTFVDFSTLLHLALPCEIPENNFAMTKGQLRERLICHSVLQISLLYLD